MDVSQQIARILDTTPPGPAEVIVRVAGPDAGQDLVDAAVHGYRERGRCTGSRAVLPPPRASLRADQPPGGSAGLASRIARRAIPPVDRPGLRAAALRALEPLLGSAELNSAAPADRPAAITVFWTARAALLRLDRDALPSLPAFPEVVEVHLNRPVPVPPISEQATVPLAEADLPASSWGIRRAQALAVWGSFGARGEGVTVGVLDTGIDPDHPDLAGKLAGWAQFDRTGRPVDGSQPHDSHRHGTHVAGIVAGGDASGSWIGMAPDSRIAAALVLDGDEGGTDAQILAGFDWAIEQGVDVLNLSLGGLTLGPETPNTYTQAIVTMLREGVPVVAAVGNSGAQTSGAPGNDLFAFAVGATDVDDLVAGFSGGRTHVVTQSDFLDPGLLPLTYAKPDVSAPGVAVRSSVPGGDYAIFSGTSMAAPHAAGALALLLSATRIRDEVQAPERAFLLQDLLVGAVEDLGEGGQDHRYGFGRIDALRAAALATERGYSS